MQLNRTGVWLLAFFGLGGLAIAIAGIVAPMPAEARLTLILLGGIWALVAAGLVLYARSENRKAEHRLWVVQQGLKGTATVVGASSSATVNEMPVMKLQLDLEIPGQGTRRVKRSEIMSVFAARRLQPGIVLPAYANPRDPEDWVLVW